MRHRFSPCQARRLVLETLEHRRLLATDVTVSAERVDASEAGPAPGVFRFTRTGDLASALQVSFALGGTATPGEDFLVWEPTAHFSPGAATAFVSVLPRNDALLEIVETIEVAIQPGAGYSVGTPNAAEVWVTDALLPGADGVMDSPDPVYPALGFLDAHISGGELHVVMDFEYGPGPFGLANVDVFLDADQNPETGDVRVGYVGGAEYRLAVTAGVINGYDLYLLPGSPGDEQLLGSGPGRLEGDRLFLDLPLSLIDQPAAVDVFALSSGAFSGSSGSGDRVPNFGALDTASGQVVIRQARSTQITTVTDATGDQGAEGRDLVAAEFTSIADQFETTLRFSETVDPADPSFLFDLHGELIVDGDRSLGTGGVTMGDEIPTWGGDQRISFQINDLNAQLLLQPGPSGFVLFGEGENDGRWLARENALSLAGSQSLLDAFQLTTTGSDEQQVVRLPSLASPLVQAQTTSLTGATADRFGEPHQAIDVSTGRFLSPFTWQVGKTVTAPDPVELNVSGDDLIRVDAQVIDNHLVVKGGLTTWLLTDVENRFEVALDVDADASTGRRLANGLYGATGEEIGADYTVRVSSEDEVLTTYHADLLHPDGRITVHDAWLLPEPVFGFGETASFTVTVPLDKLQGVGPQMRLYVTTARPLAGPTDVAPPSPLLVPLSPPTIQQIVINDGSQSRSQITSLTVTFDSRVDHGPLQDAFKLTNLTTDQQVGLANVEVTNPDGRTNALLTFAGTSTIPRQGTGTLGNSLADGDYWLEVDAAQVRAAGGLEMEDDHHFGDDDVDAFFRFFGDTDGDSDVDGQDGARFARAFLRTLEDPEFNALVDADGDGDVDGQDHARFRRQLLRRL
jgi:hypothetical protein